MKYLGLIVPIILFLIPTTVSSKTIPWACVPYLPLVEKYDWNVQTAISVMYAESGCNPNAVNLNDTHTVKKDKINKELWYCTGSFGLYQTSCANVVYYDPALNIALAYQIYEVQSWKAWGTCLDGKVNCKI
jgi:hypothetical protein